MERLNKKTGKKLNTVQYQSLDTINLSKVSERRYQDLFNNASDAIFIRDLKGNIIEVNEGAVTLTGYTHNELTGMNASEFLTAESFKLIMKKQKALLEDEAANQRYELEIIRKDGVRLSAESRTSLLTHNGRPIGVQGIVRDITERKQMEEALRFLSSVLEQAKDSIIVTNHNYEIEYVNKATEELYGYSQEELVGLTPLILNAEPMAEDIQRDIYKTVSSGEVMTGTVLNKRKDGSTFVCDFKVSPLSDKDGRVLGYIGIQRDITEQRRMEEALQASEERFRNIYEESPIGIELYDCDARLLTVNRACLDIFGVSNIAEVQGFKLFDDLNITDEVKQRLRKRETVRYEALFDFEKVKKHKLYNTSKSGTIHLNVLITPLGERREKRLGGYLVQVQDITEHKQVEKALRESEERYRTVADFTYDWEYWIDSDGDLRYISPSCERMTGYRVDEFLRDPKLLDRIIHPDDYPVIAQHINGEFKSKEALHVDFRI
ncbi:MAG TPA: PAS domain S-box protein, partial [Dehalococcoidia bacterium]|nr:PAS domain S-box protein [Dehalococcoidia bacterium]